MFVRNLLQPLSNISCVEFVFALIGLFLLKCRRIIKDIENICAGAKRAICMHCGAEQGKIMIDKPSTFKERFETKTGAKSERKLNPRDIREWLTTIPDDDLIFAIILNQIIEFIKL